MQYIDSLELELDELKKTVRSMDNDTTGAFRNVSRDIRFIMDRIAVDTPKTELDQIREHITELRFQIDSINEEMPNDDTIREAITDHSMDKMHFEDDEDFMTALRESIMKIIKGEE